MAKRGRKPGQIARPPAITKPAMTAMAVETVNRLQMAVERASLLAVRVLCEGGHVTKTFGTPDMIGAAVRDAHELAGVLNSLLDLIEQKL